MTQSELKELTSLGAELGAAKAENEKLREALQWIADYAFGDNGNEAAQRAIAALSQQPEPTDAFTAVDMATAAAQGFRDGQAAVEQAPAQDERGDELEAIHQYAFEVGGTEGGSYMLEPEELDEVARRACEPFEDVLRSLACSLGAGGYNALTVDPAVFEQKIRWGIDQLTRPAQTEQQPVAWLSYPLKGSQAGKLFITYDDQNHNPELYAAPFAVYRSSPQPEQSGLVEALKRIQRLMADREAQALDGSQDRQLFVTILNIADAALSPSIPADYSCDYAGCSSKAHPGTSLCLAHHSPKDRAALSTQRGEA